MKNRLQAAVFGSLLLAAACSGPDRTPRPDLVREGAPAPRLELPKLLNAPAARLAGIESLAGKVVVLEFWATWCGPCVENIPRLNALAEKFKDRPVVFIAVTDESAEDVQAFMRTTSLKVWAAPGTGAEVFRAYRVFGRPHTVIIGRDSVVAAVTVPSEVTEERLNVLLAGQTPAFEAAGVRNGALPDAEFYIGEPVSGERTSEYGRGYYYGHNSPLLNALGYFHADALRIDASGAVMTELERPRELRVRLPEGRAGELAAFLADGLRSALGLRFRTVKKDSSVYLLKPAHSGPKGLRRSSSIKSSVSGGLSGFKAEKTPVSALCGLLKDALDPPVLDETGLKGEYDYSFSSGARDLAGLNSALIDQLGLRIAPGTRRIAVLEVRRQ